MKHRRNDYVVYKDLADNQIHMIRNVGEGTFFVKVWTFSGRHETLPDKLAIIKNCEYYYKVEGYNIYLTMESYTGTSVMVDQYNPQLVLQGMAEWFLEYHIATKPNKYKFEKETIND